MPDVEPGQATSPADLGSGRRAEGSRRQLTVLFCDVVGSTSMSVALDPEVLRDILLAYQDACAQAVTAYDGRIAHFVGDGLMAIFGHPRAHEDDPHRAVLAGLAIIEAVKRIGRDVQRNEGVSFAARVGIHTGLAIVADMGTGERLVADDLVGAAPNIAARIQSLAAPNSVVVTATTKALVTGSFISASLGDHGIRGLDQTVELHRVDALAEADPALADPVLATLRLVGRDQELARLVTTWEECVAGAGRAVIVSGPAGIGKSRLVDALRAQAVVTEGRHVALQCSPYHQHSMMYPIRRLVERTVGISPSDEVPARVAQLTRWVKDHGGNADSEEMAVLSTLLRIPGPLLPLEPEHVRQRIFDVLLVALRTLSAEAPLLITVDDLHTADHSSLELLRRVLQEGPRPGVCLIATSRVTPGELGIDEDVPVLELGPLHGIESAIVVEDVAPHVAADARRSIVERSDGVPLFLVELTRMLAVTEGHRGAGRQREVEIPPTLHDLLLARLDQLGDNKTLAQVIATIGHAAPISLVDAVVGGDVAALRDRLNALVSARILRVDRSGVEEVYSFEHVLVRDAAYVSQLRARRRKVHARVAEVLEGWIPRSGPLFLELLAYHLEQAGETVRAAQRWLEAGVRAAAVAAHQEAVAHYHQALAALATARDHPDVAALELDINNALGLSLLAQRGYTNPEVERTFARARELATVVGAQDRVSTLFGLWAYYTVRGERSVSLDLARHSVATAGQDPVDRAAAKEMLGYDLFHVGEMEQAVQWLEQVEAEGPIEVPAFPHDMRVAVLILLAHLRWVLGARRRGWRTLSAAIERSEELGFPKGPFSRAFAHSYAAWFCQVAGDSVRAAEHAGRAIEISGEHGYASWFGASSLHLGIASSHLGPASDMIPALSEGLAAWRQAGAEAFRSYFLAGLADAHRRAGDPVSALRSAEEGLEHVDRFGERFHEAELRRLRGESLLALGNDDEGESELWRAIEVSHRQHTRSFELRSAAALYAFGATRGGPSTNVRRALRRVVAEFADDEDDDELRAARTMSATLS